MTFTPNVALATSAQYTVTISGAKDYFGNTMVPATWSFDTGSTASITDATIWPSTDVPEITTATDGTPIEAGVKVESKVAGYITGIRFYKGAGNSGTHVGHLWDASGDLLATATFMNETASGWEQVNFATAVPVQANTVYVASYYSPSGFFAVDANYFATSGVDSGPLEALSNAAAGGNGVFVEGASGFPDNNSKRFELLGRCRFQYDGAPAGGYSPDACSIRYRGYGLQSGIRYLQRAGRAEQHILHSHGCAGQQRGRHRELRRNDSDDHVYPGPRSEHIDAVHRNNNGRD